MVTKRRKKAVESLKQNRAKTMAEICRKNSKTGKGGPGIPQLLPLSVENDLRVSLPPVQSYSSNI